ncbi:DUF1127 domain-containing protein [Cognatishimia maritima]|uniref:Uncharacterized conserved protein YjiS, DUF1127 family n=1 Tax=Cognatishimia maritima TaxID=870908 RepID=A0A1M5PFD8_9RHOB|nr:DUF1127 domain-containing protein [Cognatishimia maritima]SHH00516.1 Uncharacterized conserved protein YjiS, DUF1127 family [Cognatishimia maritima]
MATQAIAVKAPFRAAGALREYNLISEIFTAFATWKEKHKTRAMLLELSDAQLDDIGLSRKDLL